MMLRRNHAGVSKSAAATVRRKPPHSRPEMRPIKPVASGQSQCVPSSVSMRKKNHSACGVSGAVKYAAQSRPSRAMGYSVRPASPYTTSVAVRTLPPSTRNARRTVSPQRSAPPGRRQLSSLLSKSTARRHIAAERSRLTMCAVRG